MPGSRSSATWTPTTAAGPLTQVVTELSQYLDWYEVDGVCLDRVATASAERALLRRDVGARSGNWEPNSCSSTTAHTRTRRTPSTPTCSAHSRAHGTLTASSMCRAWTTAWPTEKFYHVVYSVPAERFGEAAKLAVIRHAAAVYITERGGANPYDLLPIDSTELRCRGSTGFSSRRVPEWRRLALLAVTGMAVAAGAVACRRASTPAASTPAASTPSPAQPALGSQPFHGYGQELLSSWLSRHTSTPHRLGRRRPTPSRRRVT